MAKLCPIGLHPQRGASSRLFSNPKAFHPKPFIGLDAIRWLQLQGRTHKAPTLPDVPLVWLAHFRCQSGAWRTSGPGQQLDSLRLASILSARAALLWARSSASRVLRSFLGEVPVDPDPFAADCRDNGQALDTDCLLQDESYGR